MIKSQLDEEKQKFALIDERLKQVFEQIGEACSLSGRAMNEITVMAVTKTVAPIYINHAVAQGKLTLLGENRAQELCEKYRDYSLKKDNIHFIGHLQTNKVRQIIDKVCCIQSVDSLRLAEEIDKQAGKSGQIMDILAEINIGKEESKSGIMPEMAEEFATQLSSLTHIRLKGLMAIPPKENAEISFGRMQELFERLKLRRPMEVLSMGMSGDYPLAVQYGSTMVRLGSAIFGPRQ